MSNDNYYASEMSRLKRSASSDSAVLGSKTHSKDKVFVKTESPTSNSSLSPTTDHSMHHQLYSRQKHSMQSSSQHARERAVTSSGSNNRSPTSTTGAPAPSTGSNKNGAGSTQRQLNKLKRFLATLQQFGGQISPEIGERVQILVFALVCGTTSIEAFHDQLQEATNFPLRPFVIPFLKNTLPLIQNELLHHARGHKMTPEEYLRYDELFLASTQQIAQQDSFDNPMDLNVNGKRTNGDRNLDLEKKKPRIQNPVTINRLSPIPVQSSDPVHTRLHNGARGLTSLSQRPSSASRHNGFLQSHRLSPSHFARFPPRLNPVDDQLIAPISRTSSASPHRGMRRIPPQHRLFQEGRQPPVIPSRDRQLSDREWVDDCKQIDYLLTYIMDLVEKARQCLHVMHQNFDVVYDESVRWRRLYKEGDLLKRQTGEFISETEKRMSAVRKQAENDLIEVKRRLVAEMERAATDGREVHLARRHIEPEMTSRKQEDTHESCWNCGRKAQETCSGCNLARYCGSFCQHKDWENHHKVCGPDIKSRLESSTMKRPVLKSQSPSDHKPAGSTPQSPAPSSVTENKGDTGK